MMSKTIALAATALAAVLWTGAAVSQTTLPSIAQPPATEGRALAHAAGYAVTVPNDWVVATDAQGADFLMGNADLSLVCFTFHEKGVIDASDDSAIPVAPCSRARSSQSRASAVPAPVPCAAGSTASIRNSPSSSRPISRHGEPGGQ